MKQSFTSWRVIQSQQELARNNARQALLVIQQRRREQAESDNVLPLPVSPARPAARRRSSS